MFVPLFAARPRDGLETPVKTLVSVASDQLAHACQQVRSKESAAGVNRVRHVFKHIGVGIVSGLARRLRAAPPFSGGRTPAIIAATRCALTLLTCIA